jgi:DNA-binding transcriptional LysR family regulator
VNYGSGTVCTTSGKFWPQRTAKVYARAEMAYKDVPGRTRRPMPETTSRRRGGQRGARSLPSRKRLRPPRLLTYVDAVARHGSIRKAAEALNVAPSALNRQILDLEIDLGSALFERLPRGMRPTAAGELFLAYTRQAISELKAISSQVEELRGLVRGQVSIAAVESVVGDLLPETIAQFQTAHPNVLFNVHVGAPDALAASLIADQVDLVLTLALPPKKHAAIMAVGKQTLCALMVADHPLAGHKELRLHDCLFFPLALGDATLAGRALIEQALAGASFELDPRLVSNSVEAMKAFVRVNRGVCFQFRKPGNAFVPPGDMIAVPLIDAPLQQARLYLATRRGRVLPVAAAAFVELLRTQLE